MTWDSNLVSFSREVATAFETKKPIVALESTIISHGMPYPQNYQTAREVEDIIRGLGAVPATIAILNGIIRVGLDDCDLEKLAQIGRDCRKCSRRDLAAVVAEEGNGATTVAGTMYIANMVGIKVFVTGGIGGVHRGVNDTWDVSADLSELGRTPVCVICAGVKSILDIPKTLENLETRGVSVLAYGQKQFPAFFTPNSGSDAPHQVNSPEEIAALLYSGSRIGMDCGMVVGVPVPAVKAAEYSEIESATEQALAEVREKRVTGRDITPYLLLRIAELTHNRSLAANIALVKNNARVGALTALALSKLSFTHSRDVISMQANQKRQGLSDAHTLSSSNKRLLLFGGSVIDITWTPKPDVVVELRTSNPVSTRRSFGGVARNIAESLGRLGHNPLLASLVGDDASGNEMVKHAASAGIDISEIRIMKGMSTASYTCLLDEKRDMFTSVADMDILEKLTPAMISHLIAHIELLVLDTNMVSDKIWETIQMAKLSGVKVFLEPVSAAKAKRIVPPDGNLKGITYIFPNRVELKTISTAIGYMPSRGIPDDKAQCLQLLKHGVENVILTLGEAGALVARYTAAGTPAFDHIPAVSIPESSIRNTQGCGDALVAGTVSGIADGLSVTDAVRRGVILASETLKADGAVSQNLESFKRSFSKL